MEHSDSDTQPENNSVDLPSSSLSSGQLTDDPTKPFRKKYRSKSAVSNDPRSPYYTSQGLTRSEENNRVGGKFAKSQSVSCVPGYDCTRYADKLPFNGGIAGLNLSPDDPKAATIRQHYYPEGGWGYVVCFCAFLVEVISGGLQASFGLLLLKVLDTFGKELLLKTVFLGASSMFVTLLTTPVFVSLSRRKSPRLLALLGGLLGALGCLFTSFASQFHQLYFSYGLVLGVGLGITRAITSIMVGQYFKKRRELMEIFLVLGSGVGMAVVPLLVLHSVSTLGWRLGLQAMTGLVSLTIVLAVLYRPASLYHPQRRAILHLKGLQKRSKAKDNKNAQQREKPPFFDFTVLKSRTVQILIFGSALSAFGVNAPLFLLMYQSREEGIPYDSLHHLQAYLGMASSLGTLAMGYIVVKNSVDCYIARQYLAQSSLVMMGLAMLAFMAFREHSGYVLFASVYGFFFGGYTYSLKVFTFEKVRARNFARAWGYVQGAQALPLLIGTTLTSHLNEQKGDRSGYYFASSCILAGGFLLFFINVHKRNVKRQKSNALSSRFDPTESERMERAYFNRRVTLQDIGDARIFAKQHKLANDLMHRQELTCISEEVMMDNIFEDYVDDCITSCNKEEKYLMLSEFENNLLNTQDSSSVSQEVRKLAQERKVSSSSPPMLEHCPNCLRVVPLDGGTYCEYEEQFDVPKKTHISRSSAKKYTISRRKDDLKATDSPLQNEIIDEVTSSL